jgi:hypothetical protein
VTKELLAKIKDQLDDLIEKYDKKPQVAPDSTPAPSKDGPPDTGVPSVPSSLPLTPEQIAARYREALEDRAKQERAEMDMLQAEYQRDWDRGWEPW